MSQIIRFIFNKKFVRTILKLFFSIQVKGIENIKNLQGNVLFIANHNSFLDAFLLWAFIPENLCFTINPLVAKKWYVKPFLHLAKFFQIEPNNPMTVKSIIREVKNGHKIVIYPEGRVTTTGTMMKIYPGPGMIADKTNAQIVPVYIEGSQYTIFSASMIKIRLRTRVKITVNIFPATKLNIPDMVTGEDRKKQITKQLFDIMTNAKYLSLPNDRPLFEYFIESVSFFGRRKEIIEDIARKPLSYGKLLTTAFVLGKQYIKYCKPKEYVGVLLPNAVATVATIYGMQSFNIVPCMLNFSTGTKNMISCCKTTALKKVLTSKQFVKKGGFEELIEIMEKEGLEIIYLEDISKKITLTDKIIGLIASFFPKYYYNKHKGSANVKDPAVVLYTSGSEGVPKAVVLTNENIKANVNQINSILIYGIKDKFFSALPIFHSFGFTASTMVPILSGVKAFYYPTPLHYKIIPELIYDTNSTVTFGTDTFFNGYAKNAHAYDFYSVKIAVVGAERLKEDTIKKFFTNFGIRVMGGYGATETSPVLSVNTDMYYKKGSVGRILPGIEIKLETIPGIQDGKRLYVKGKNVMLGYMKSDKPGVIQPLEDGWYDTGDIVSIDKDGFITIKGRAKRFAKIAGEMVSLTAVETNITKLWPEYQHSIVAIPEEKKGEQLVLFTTRPNTVFSEISADFKSQGLSDLFVPKKIKVLEEMLLMANGKVDYVGLNEKAKELFG